MFFSFINPLHIDTILNFKHFSLSVLKMLIIKAEIHKRLVRTANREDRGQTKWFCLAFSVANSLAQDQTAPLHHRRKHLHATDNFSRQFLDILFGLFVLILFSQVGNIQFSWLNQN